MKSEATDAELDYEKLVLEAFRLANRDTRIPLKGADTIRALCRAVNALLAEKQAAIKERDEARQALVGQPDPVLAGSFREQVRAAMFKGLIETETANAKLIEENRVLRRVIEGVIHSPLHLGAWTRESLQTQLTKLSADGADALRDKENVKR